jgi:hypothetical protein
LITLQVTGDAQQKLEILAERLGDFTKPITEMLSSALADAVVAIESQGSAFGETFAPMSELTPIVSTKLYGLGRSPGTLLQATSALVRSLVPGQPGNVFEVAEMEGRAGSSLRSARSGFAIAKGQQEGTSRTFHVLQGQGFSEPGIPPRRFLAWRETRFDEYRRFFATYIQEGVA